MNIKTRLRVAYIIIITNAWIATPQVFAAPIEICAEQSYPEGKIILAKVTDNSCSTKLKIVLDDPSPGVVACKNFQRGFSLITPHVPTGFVISNVTHSNSCGTKVLDNAITLDTPYNGQQICSFYLSGSTYFAPPLPDGFRPTENGYSGACEDRSGFKNSIILGAVQHQLEYCAAYLAAPSGSLLIPHVPTGYVVSSTDWNPRCGAGDGKTVVIAQPDLVSEACPYYSVGLSNFAPTLPTNIVVTRFYNERVRCDGTAISIDRPYSGQEMCLSYPGSPFTRIYPPIPDGFTVISRRQTWKCGSGNNTGKIVN